MLRKVTHFQYCLLYTSFLYGNFVCVDWSGRGKLDYSYLLCCWGIEMCIRDRTNALCDELEQRVENGVSVVPAGTKRIMLTGTPLAIPNWKLHNIIETSGGVVVCEEMCTGTRYFENLVDETKETVDDQIQALAERYMKINCACFTQMCIRDRK